MLNVFLGLAWLFLNDWKIEQNTDVVYSSNISKKNITLKNIILLQKNCKCRELLAKTLAIRTILTKISTVMMA